MPPIRNCVFGCVTTGVTVHNFPQPLKFPERFRSWVTLAGSLLEGLSDIDIYKKKKVCDIHFTDNHRNRYNRLSAIAIPVLHLPGTRVTSSTEPELIHGISTTSQVHTAGFIVTTPADSADSAGTRVTSSTEPELIHGISTTSQVHTAGFIVTTPADSADRGDIPTTSHSQVTAIAEVTALDHNYCASSYRKSKSKTGFRRTVPTSKVRFYKDTQREVKNLRRQINRLRKQGQNFKARLENAEKLSNSQALQKVTELMTPSAKLFTSMQYRETAKKSKGRRFTTEEKILSLTLYKRSPKSYSLLSKCFTLPSSKTLKKLLAKIKITPGVNTILFEKLKKTVSGISDDDKLCCLIFDEMSISPQLHYDAASDSIKGFTTKESRTNVIADHALVFMVRGIKKNYKQPVAYYFTNSLNKYELKQAIKEVVQQVNNTGLNQGPKNRYFRVPHI